MRFARTLFGLWVLFVGCDKKKPDPPRVTVKGKSYRVERISTREGRKSFLKGRATLGADQGVLVEYPGPRFHHYEPELYGAFDVAFFGSDLKVLEVQMLDPNRKEGITSEVETTRALFIPFNSGVSKGDEVQIDYRGVDYPAPEGLVPLDVGGHPVLSEIASTPAETQHGLMFRPRLGKEEGMLFVFPEPAPQEFWMGNTWIPLDIAFFAASGDFINVVSLATYPDPANDSEPKARSADPAKYVLEMNRGWFKEKGLTDAAGIAVKPFRIVIPPGDLK